MMAERLSSILDKSRRVTLQLSNLCTFTPKHPLCPTSTFTEKQILPARIVHDVIDTLAAVGYNSPEKEVSWHVYNEPLIDPRLMDFVKYARAKCDKVRIILWSNGWYLDEGLTEEFIDAGATDIHLSGYTESERERFGRIADKLGHKATFAPRLVRKLKPNVLSTEEVPSKFYRRCQAPLCDITIRASGNLGLCCLDHAETVTFGNLHEETFATVLQRAYPEMAKLYAELRAKNRTLAVCQQCSGRRM